MIDSPVTVTVTVTVPMTATATATATVTGIRVTGIRVTGTRVTGFTVTVAVTMTVTAAAYPPNRPSPWRGKVPFRDPFSTTGRNSILRIGGAAPGRESTAAKKKLRTCRILFYARPQKGDFSTFSPESGLSPLVLEPRTCSGQGEKSVSHHSLAIAPRLLHRKHVCDGKIGRQKHAALPFLSIPTDRCKAPIPLGTQLLFLSSVQQTAELQERLGSEARGDHGNTVTCFSVPNQLECNAVGYSDCTG